MKYQIRKGCFETNSSSCHSLIVTKKNSNIRMTQEEIRHEFYLDEDWYKERHKNNEEEIVKIDPWDNDFGRSPFNVLVTFEDKLAYAIAEYCGNNYSIKSYLESEKVFDEMFRPLLIRLIGCDDIEWDRWDDRPFEIYVGGGDNLDEVEQVPYDKLIYVDKDKRKDLSEDDLVRGMYKNVDIDGRPIEEAWFDVPKFGGIDHQSAGLLKRFLKDNNLSLEDYLIRKDIVVVITGDEFSTLSDMFECGLINKDSIVLQFPKEGSFDSYLYEESENEKTD